MILASDSSLVAFVTTSTKWGSESLTKHSSNMIGGSVACFTRSSFWWGVSYVLPSSGISMILLILSWVFFLEPRNVNSFFLLACSICSCSFRFKEAMCSWILDWSSFCSEGRRAKFLLAVTDLKIKSVYMSRIFWAYSNCKYSDTNLGAAFMTSIS